MFFCFWNELKHPVMQMNKYHWEYYRKPLWPLGSFSMIPSVQLAYSHMSHSRSFRSEFPSSSSYSSLQSLRSLLLLVSTHFLLRKRQSAVPTAYKCHNKNKSQTELFQYGNSAWSSRRSNWKSKTLHYRSHQWFVRNWSSPTNRWTELFPSLWLLFCRSTTEFRFPQLLILNDWALTPSVVYLKSCGDTVIYTSWRSLQNGYRYFNKHAQRLIDCGSSRS